MKKLSLLLALLVALFVTSCSDDSKLSKFSELLPAEADIVAVGDVKTIIESAGGSLDGDKLTMPAAINSRFDEYEKEKLNECNNFLSTSGIELTVGAIVCNYKDLNHSTNPVVVFSLNDNEKFIKAITKQGFEKGKVEGDIEFYTKPMYRSEDYPEWNSDSYMAISGSVAYWMPEADESANPGGEEIIKSLIAGTKEKSFADTKQGEYATKGNAAGVYFRFPSELKETMATTGLPADLLAIYDGGVAINSNLDKDKLSFNVKMFDKDGNEFDIKKATPFADRSSEIGNDALKLLTKDETLVYAVAMKDFNWDKYAEIFAAAASISRVDRAQLNLVFSYLKKINGTVATGFGLTDGLNSIKNLQQGNNPLAQFSATFVVETKDKNAESVIKEIKGLMQRMDVAFNETKDGVSLDLTSMGMPGAVVYLEEHDDFLVLANHPIAETKDNPVAKYTDMEECLAAFGIVLNRDNKLMADLGINNDVKFLVYGKPSSAEATVELEIDGEGGKGVIEKAINIIMGLVDKSRLLNDEIEKPNMPLDTVDCDTLDIDI